MNIPSPSSYSHFSLPKFSPFCSLIRGVDLPPDLCKDYIAFCPTRKIPMDRTLQSESMRSPTVLSIECLKGSSKADEWTGDMLQTGDIVEEIRIGSGSGLAHKAPFKGGRSAVQRVLHSSYKNKETSILVRVRRGNDELAQLQACIVPNESGGKKQYMLRSIADPNYAVGFLDRTESECFELQG